GPNSFSYQWVERDDVAAPHANLIRLQWRGPSGDQVSMLRGDMAGLYRTDGCGGSADGGLSGFVVGREWAETSPAVVRLPFPRGDGHEGDLGGPSLIDGAR